MKIDWLSALRRKQRETRRRRLARLMSRTLHVETMEDRRLLAVVAYTAGTDALEFTGISTQDIVDISSPGAGSLVFMVGGADTITLTDDAAANSDFVLSNSDQTLTIDTSSSAIDDFTANLNSGADLLTFTNDISAEIGGTILINGNSGKDVLDARLAGKGVTMKGNLGDDILHGSEFADNLDGGGSSDMLFGRGGNDRLIENTELVSGDSDLFDGGAGDDVLEGFDGDETFIGGPGNDTIRGLNGNDRIIWNNGDGNDMIDGGNGVDTLEINLNDGLGDMVTTSDGGAGRLDFIRADGGVGLEPFSLDIATTETLDVNGLAGDDTATVPDLSAVADLTTLNIDLGDGGADTININGDPDVDITLTAEAINLFANLTGAQTYKGAVVLGADRTLTSTGGGNITFDGTIDGAHDLALNTAGTTRFNGNIGGSTALTSLMTDASGTTILNGPGNSTANPAIKTTGVQNFHDVVVLGADLALTSTGGGNITFDGTIDGAHDLALNTAGTTRFNGKIGGSTALASLTTDASGTTILNGLGNGTANPAIKTTGVQDFHDAVTLATNTALQGQNILFDSTVDGGRNLIASVSQALTFNDEVGGTTTLEALQINTNGTTFINGGLIRTANIQTYLNNVLLDSATNSTTLESTGATITLGQNSSKNVQSASDGVESLIITASNVTLNSLVGDNNLKLNDLTINGPVAINGNSITTAGDQTYNGAVVLGVDAQQTGQDITFESTIDLGSFTLTNDVAGASSEAKDVISGTGNLAKAGAGLMTLGVNNTFSGTTTINNGLLSTRNLQSLSVIVNSGGTLEASGAIAGSVQVNNGGVMAPGPNRAISDSGDLTLLSGAVLNVDINNVTPGIGHDQLRVTGTVDLGGANLNLAGIVVIANGDSVTFLENDGSDPIVGTFNGFAEGDKVFVNGRTMTISYVGGDGNDVTLAVTDIHLVVDTLDDESDGDFSMGDLSLREALELTNANPGADTITFASPLFDSVQTITLGGTELAITESVTITGPGQDLLTIDANAASRVFNVDDGNFGVDQDVFVSGMTLRNGRIDSGGFFDVGGAIFTSENLTITGSTIADSASVGSAGGGGIYKANGSSKLTLIQSTVSGNVASNAAHGGGGIYLYEGAAEIIDSTISGNTASSISNGGGGGISVYAGSLLITGSTISGNSSTNRSSSSSFGGGGIGITSGSLTIRRSTITNNAAFTDGGGLAANGGGIDEINGNVTLEHTIVANNSAVGVGNDIAGTVTANWSLIGDGDGATIGGTGNLIGSSSSSGIIGANLGPLQNNGGTTETHALLASSPAIDAGNPAAVAGVGNTPQSDQRGTGFNRVGNGRIDIGAFEVQSPNSPPAISPQTYNVAENQTAVGTVSATDPDLPSDTRNFSITGSGADDAQFSITPAGVLTFKVAPDFENPTDVGGTPGNNVYEVEVKVKDAAGESTMATITVTVWPANDAPVVVNPPSNQSYVGGLGFEFVLPTGVFDDEDARDTLVLSAGLADGSDLPDWLVFNTYAGTFTGSPSWDLDEVLDVKVTANDSAKPSLSAATTFQLTITPNSTPWQNPSDPFDVDDSEGTTAYDVLLVATYINDNGTGQLPAPPAGLLQPPFYDVNGDGYATPVDVLLVINHINIRSATPEGEMLEVGALDTVDSAVSRSAQTIADEYLAGPLMRAGLERPPYVSSDNSGGSSGQALTFRSANDSLEFGHGGESQGRPGTASASKLSADIEPEVFGESDLFDIDDLEYDLLDILADNVVQRSF